MGQTFGERHRNHALVTLSQLLPFMFFFVGPVGTPAIPYQALRCHQWASTRCVGVWDANARWTRGFLDHPAPRFCLIRTLAIGARGHPAEEKTRSGHFIWCEDQKMKITFLASLVSPLIKPCADFGRICEVRSYSDNFVATYDSDLTHQPEMAYSSRFPPRLLSE